MIYTDGNGDLRIPWSEVQPGAIIRGLAPIGVRWPGQKASDGTVRVAKGCPLNEWLPCEARVKAGDGSYQWAHIEADTGPIVKSGHTAIFRGSYFESVTR